MVTCNIATAANLANGSRGTIIDIILDPCESQLISKNIEHKISASFCYSTPRFHSISRRARFTSERSSIVSNHEKVQHWKTIGFCTATATCTDACLCIHRFQETIDHVLVDLGKTVQFSLSPFNAYVALSRSQGRDTNPSEDLREEEHRLENLAKETKKDYYDGKYGNPMQNML
jgi:hypothetical protein